MYETPDGDYVTLGIDSEYVNDRLMSELFKKIQKTSTDLDENRKPKLALEIPTIKKGKTSGRIPSFTTREDVKKLELDDEKFNGIVGDILNATFLVMELVNSSTNAKGDK